MNLTLRPAALVGEAPARFITNGKSSFTVAVSVRPIPETIRTCPGNSDGRSGAVEPCTLHEPVSARNRMPEPAMPRETRVDRRLEGMGDMMRVAESRGLQQST